jgi:hypothetical protein
VPQLNESGHLLVNGHSVDYLIRRLPVSSFPELPVAVAEELNRRGCLIPQTWQAHGPENVIHTSLEYAGSSDWAALCSAEGRVSLLVLFGSAPKQAQILASMAENDRLQAHDASGVLGFNWGIDPATPEQVRLAQMGVDPKPARIDHDALADSWIDRRTVYHYFSQNAWTVLRVPD